MSESKDTSEGYRALWGWFCLSRASFLTLPRVLMHEMPDEWQGKMTALLEEYEAAFPNQPDIGTRVQITENGKLVKTPDWILNYRHPQKSDIARLREDPFGRSA